MNSATTAAQLGGGASVAAVTNIGCFHGQNIRPVYMSNIFVHRAQLVHRARLIEFKFVIVIGGSWIHFKFHKKHHFNKH